MDSHPEGRLFEQNTDGAGKSPLRSLVVLSAMLAASSAPQVTCGPVWGRGGFIFSGPFCAREPLSRH